MKKFLVITMLVLAAAAFTLTPTISEATCEGYGYIIRVSTLPGSSLTYIYFRTSSLSNVYYYATSTDSKIIGAAHNAVTSRVSAKPHFL